jgi:hypothetical protein
MSSWLELILNVIGYGGFMVLASRHRPYAANERSEDVTG